MPVFVEEQGNRRYLEQYDAVWWYSSMRKIHRGTHPQHKSSHTLSKKRSWHFGPHPLRTAGKVSMIWRKIDDFFLREKHKCELIFTRSGWFFTFLTTHRDHLMMAMGAISFLRMSPSQLPQKKIEWADQLSTKTRAIRALSFWDALQLHSYKANSTCFVSAWDFTWCFPNSCPQKAVQHKSGKELFHCHRDSFKESNLQKSATKTCQRVRQAETSWYHPTKIPFTLFFFFKTNLIYGRQKGRTSRKAGPGSRAPRCFAVTPRMRPSCFHHFFLTWPSKGWKEWEPGNVRTKKKTWNQKKVPFEKKNPIHIFLGLSWMSIMIECQSPSHCKESKQKDPSGKDSSLEDKGNHIIWEISQSSVLRHAIRKNPALFPLFGQRGPLKSQLPTMWDCWFRISKYSVTRSRFLRSKSPRILQCKEVNCQGLCGFAKIKEEQTAFNTKKSQKVLNSKKKKKLSNTLHLGKTEKQKNTTPFSHFKTGESPEHTNHLPCLV